MKKTLKVKYPGWSEIEEGSCAGDIGGSFGGGGSPFKYTDKQKKLKSNKKESKLSLLKIFESQLGFWDERDKDKRTPTVYGIKMGLRIDEKKAQEIYDLMQESYPHHQNLRIVNNNMDKIDEIMGGYGVEFISRKNNRGLYYVNMGDTYATTVIYDSKNHAYWVMSWGDIVEVESDEFE